MDKEEKVDRVSKIKKMLSKGLTSKHDTTSPFERLVNICKTSGDEILDDDGHTYEYRFHRRALEHYLTKVGRLDIWMILTTWFFIYGSGFMAIAS